MRSAILVVEREPDAEAVLEANVSNGEKDGNAAEVLSPPNGAKGDYKH